MKKQSFLLVLFSVMYLFFLASCQEEHLLPPEAEAEWVNVSLCIGLEQPEDGYISAPQTRTDDADTGFSAEPVAIANTRAVQLIPDKLYSLEIGQYNASGTRLASKTDFGTVELGQELTLGLQQATGCQLLVVVRGASNFIGSIGTNTLAGVRSGINTLWSNITNIPADSPSQADINKMPYFLLLENVNVTSDGKITNPDGTDVRLLLKRLAARVKLSWNFAISGYDLAEVNLQQVPKLYRLLPTPYETIGGVGTYPSLLDEYVNAYRLIHGAKENPLTDEQTKAGSHTVWVPANVRGVVPEVVNQYYRSKDNAPTGAMFAEFRVERSTDKSRLLCRAYIGSNSTSDFNVRENTDYIWNVSLKTGDTTDPRVTAQSLDGARSVNLANTANCFMMEPGSDICFNPYKHTSGTDGWNDKLVDLSSGTPAAILPITSVKVLWQMKDAGMTGDLVMGYAIDAENHQNLVDITDATNLDKALVHVVTPVTKGGNAIIAAYNGNDILWSWHLWITDYVPHKMDASATYTQAQSLSRNGTVHRYNNAMFNTGDYKDKVIMDRNLGATAGGFPGKDATSSEFARRYGLSYEFSRKDPFFASVDGTPTNKNVIYDGFGNGSEVTAISIGTAGVQKDGTALEYSIRHPTVYMHSGYDSSWYTSQNRLAEVTYFWQKDNVTKALYNPCPEGWMVPHINILSGITVNNAQWFNTNLSFIAKGAVHATKGGRLYRLTGADGTPEASPDISAYSWFPVTGFRNSGGIQFVNKGYLWGWNLNTGNKYRGFYLRNAETEFLLTSSSGLHSETCMVRCVQQ